MAPTPKHPFSWWQKLCQWLWPMMLYLWGTLIVSIITSTLANLSTVTADTSLSKLLIVSVAITYPLPVFSLFGGLVLLTIIIGMGSHKHQVTFSFDQQNRTRMLKRLNYRYGTLLTQALQGAPWLGLSFVQKPDAVHSAHALLGQSVIPPERLLPVGTSIEDLYEQAGEELLILGEPGAGKSTLLLHLAQWLVAQATRNKTDPLPIILPLSSWAIKQPALEEWIVEEFMQIYVVPRHLAQWWVQKGQVRPLLDGLDEMEVLARSACIAAINTYHRNYLVPLVICSRRHDYEVAAKHERLALHDAVVVQPLTSVQVDTYLAQAGQSLIALRSILEANPALQELALTPLMLNVMMQTYQGTMIRELTQKEVQLQQQVWVDYVQRMVEHKGNAKRYPLEQTCSWLRWLAQQMRMRSQTVFYLEHLQPDWLPSKQQHAYNLLAVRFPAILIGILAGFIVALFFGTVDAVSLCQYGALGGFLGGFFSTATREHVSVLDEQGNIQRQGDHLLVKRLAISALVGLIVGMSLAWYFLPGSYTLRDWFRDGCTYSVIIGLSSWIVMSLRSMLTAELPQQASAGSARNWQLLLSILRTGYGRTVFLVAVVFGGGHGLSVGVSNLLNYGLSYGLTYGLSDVLNDGLSFGLNIGLISILVSLLLRVQARNVQLTEHLRWSWGSLLGSLWAGTHRKGTLLLVSLVALMAGLNVGLTYVLRIGLSFGLSYGLLAGLIYGLSIGLSIGIGIGLSIGFSIGLGYWLLLGLFQGIVSEQIEDQERQVPGEGMRRSIRNSILMGLISGILIGLVGIFCIGASQGLSIGLSQGISIVVSNALHVGIGPGQSTVLSVGLDDILNYGWSYGLNIGLPLGVSGGLLVCLISGGLAAWRHYVLRFLLWRAHIFPWNAQHFLNDATARFLLRRLGGSYSFMHRLLLDSFVQQKSTHSDTWKRVSSLQPRED